MNTFFKQKKEALIIAVIIGIIVILLLILIFSSLSNPTTTNQQGVPTNTQLTPEAIHPNTTSVPTSNPKQIESSNEYKDSVDKIAEKNKSALQRDAAVADLLDIVPYKGSHFTLTYSYKTNEFTLVVDKNNKALGSQEFDQWLKEHNVDSRSWIKNLTYK